MDPAKLKVIELRAELSARGLDTKGVKAVLVDRLKQALEEETGQEVPDSSIVETSTEETSILETTADNSEEQDKVQSQPSEPESFPEKEPSPEPEKRLDSEQDSEETAVPSQPQTFEEEPTTDSQDPVFEQEDTESREPAEQQSSEEAEVSQDLETSQDAEVSQDVDMEENVDIKQEPHHDDYGKQDYEEKPHIDDYKQNYEDQPNYDNYQGYDDKKENYEAEVKMEPGVDVKEENQHEDRKRKRSRWSPQKQEKQGWGQRPSWGDRGGDRSRDEEPELDDKAVVLGWYDSDLNLVIDKSDFLEAGPMSEQGFGFIWAGCRATYGFKEGKVCYEVKLLENHDVSHLEDEPSPHVLRVGWSVLSTSMLLGEEPMSYGYGGTGKASVNCKFTNYGTTFVVGDTVTAYLDYGESVKISFAVNGQHQGTAFTFPAAQVNDQPLFPHILSKNIKFRANFGQSESEFPPEPGYTWAALVPEEQRVAGPRRPENRGDCEMLMMCGLPGCGKTTWANAYVQENPDKFYNILGTNNLIDKMKIQGLPRKRNYHGRWDVLIDKCTKCLNKLLDMASKRRRNYILDQTNVYPSAQKRKMRNFGGFIRRAIVIVPTDEEFQRRVAKREAEEGKDIPDSAVLEMKANFRLPEQGEHFDEVRYIELNEEESRPLVEQYNKEGKAAGFGQQSPFSGGGGKKFRPNDRPPFRGGDRGGGRGFRGGRGFGGGHDRRDRSDDRSSGGRGGGFRSGGPPRQGSMDRGGRGGWQPRGGDRGGPRGGGGWRDRSPGYDRDDSRPQGGGPWRNNRPDSRDRPYDRNQRGRGGRGGFDRGDNFRDDYNRGGGYDRDDFRGGYNSRDGGFNNRDGGGRGGRGRGGFDRDQRGGGRGGFDRRGGSGSGFNDRRGGGGNRDGGFDRNRGGPGPDRRDNKGGNSNPPDNNQNGQRPGASSGGASAGSWGGNQGQGGYNQGWGQQGYNNQGGYNQGYNQSGYNQGYNQAGWGQQGWGNKSYTGTAQQAPTAQATPTAAAATSTATPAVATGYNTTGYQAGFNQAQYPQGYWGQYGYGQGWTQNADGTYSYPQNWQQYGYNYAQTAAAATMPAQGAAQTAAAPQAPAK